MATEPRTTGLTYDDLLQMFPEESHTRRELIGGELFVTPTPTIRHQRIVTRLTVMLSRYVEEHGGEVFGVELDTLISPSDVVQPDLMYFDQEGRRQLVERPVTVPPVLAVEVSSPSTRARDRTKKRDLYARFGVSEYWFVDISQEAIEVFRLQGGAYGDPEVVRRGEMFRSAALTGFEAAVDDILGPSQN